VLHQWLANLISNIVPLKFVLHYVFIFKYSIFQSFLCPECGAAFKSNSALIDHRKRVHLQVGLPI
jgi:hypothetical protein